LDYSLLAREMPKYVKALILFKGEASKKIISNFTLRPRSGQEFSAKGGSRWPSGQFPISNFGLYKNVKSMRGAVRLAWKSAKRGDIILLSPAAASFNMFRNEFDRGEQFVRAVKNLK
jgi:UDP-N-acetylmuramoylalanine-D-glutamate ligase